MVHVGIVAGSYRSMRWSDAILSTHLLAPEETMV
jgi:hypothetical protein